MTKKGKFLFAEDKILMLNKGILYCSSKKEIEPPMESLGNKYNEWKQLGDLGLNEANIMVKSFTNSTSKISVYTLTSNNIAHIEFESGCDKFAITNYILSDDELFEWGKVNAFEYAQSLQTLFIATKNNGALAVNLNTNTNKKRIVENLTIDNDKIKTKNSEALTLLFVEKWNALFVSYSIALLTYRFDPTVDESILISKLLSVSHEWIGGSLGTEVVDLEFDNQNDFLWVAESESLHKISDNGMQYRMGWLQGSPMYNISSVSIINGKVYSGSSTGMGMSRVSTNAYPIQNTFPDHSGLSSTTTTLDPWTWSYYYGHRYLPSNKILSIIADTYNIKDRNGQSVLVVTDVGLTYLRSEKMTLKNKATAMQSFQNPRHNRHGLISPVALDE
jgi:hypothetical protein